MAKSSVAERKPVIHRYVRASTDRQVLTLEAQKGLLDASIDMRRKGGNFDYEDGEIYVDPGTSGRVPWFNRPAGMQLYMACKPGDLIAVANFDRAFRSVVDLSNTLVMLQDLKIDLWILDMQVDTSTPIGKAFAQMFAVMKEYERTEIARRVRDAKAVSRSKGRVQGPDYGLIGWKRVGPPRQGRYVPDVQERETAYEIVLMVDRHGMSFQDIAKNFRERGVTRRCGHIWKRERIAKAYMALKCGFPLAYSKYIPSPYTTKLFKFMRNGRRRPIPVPSGASVWVRDVRGVDVEFPVRDVGFPEYDDRLCRQLIEPEVEALALPCDSQDHLHLDSCDDTQPSHHQQMIPTPQGQ